MSLTSTAVSKMDDDAVRNRLRLEIADYDRQGMIEWDEEDEMRLEVEGMIDLLHNEMNQRNMRKMEAQDGTQSQTSTSA